MKFTDLSYKEQRLITNSRPVAFPEHYTVRDSCISPESFCDWKTGRAFFRDAHQYFNMLTKNYEAYSEFSALLEDTACLTDDEMYSLACSLAKKKFNADTLSAISESAKQELARTMHFDYRAANGQIRRILKMDPNKLEAMFPTAR